MNPILNLINGLAELKNTLRTRFNAAIGNLGPIEQVEAAQPVITVLREIDWASHRINEISGQVDTVIAAAEETLRTMTETAVTAAISEQVTAGALIRKEDHETLITAAADKAKKEVEQQFQAAADNAAALRTKREAITKDHGLHVAAALTDDDLAAEDADTRINRVTKRSADLKEAGILAEGTTEKFHASMLACANTAEGDKEFDSRLDAFKSTGFKASAQAPVTAPRGLPPGSSESKKLIA
jgi:hypothetical protein